MKWWPFGTGRSSEVERRPEEPRGGGSSPSVRATLGTESAPLVRGNRNQNPVKYPCFGCGRWWVEPEVDLMLRDKGERYSSCTYWLYEPMCIECASVAVAADWKRHTEESQAEWKAILHE